jgi:hypothetical protein
MDQIHLLVDISEQMIVLYEAASALYAVNEEITPRSFSFGIFHFLFSIYLEMRFLFIILFLLSAPRRVQYSNDVPFDSIYFSAADHLSEEPYLFGRDHARRGRDGTPSTTASACMFGAGWLTNS